MIYVKSVLVGLTAALIASVLCLCVYFMLVVFVVAPKVPTGQSVGIDIRSVFGGPIFWLIALLAFAIGWYWEFRGA
jgi:hypothetical protein